MSCVGGIGQDRPKAFETKPDGGHTLRILRRVKERTEAQAKADEDVIRRFVGTWRFDSMRAEGRPVPIEALKDAKLVLDGDRFAMTDANGTVGGVYWVDASAAPMTLDIVFTDGPERGKGVRAIFQLEGDTYTSCVDVAGRGRPKAFTAEPGSGHVLQVLKREKPGN